MIITDPRANSPKLNFPSTQARIQNCLAVDPTTHIAQYKISPILFVSQISDLPIQLKLNQTAQLLSPHLAHTIRALGHPNCFPTRIDLVRQTHHPVLINEQMKPK
ncbi:hypothetical protein HanHA300_Chr01g0004161 [Helianthus annuus]|nr:hypothetical protein HanHA300_Chr01g0004161 [Helianthus annuus]KAJ0625720.1 hypothetical protein HanHA89_Chr01g0004781 [Helianthus annuus]KAJ0807280.1 hypothetical protein HanLR1_Chr00c1278g0799191 [Helianthus annuus]